MRVRRYFAAAVFGALSVLWAPTLATAGTITHRDANDVGGRLDIKWARHGHSGGDLVHTIETWGSFASRALTNGNMVAFEIDTNRNWGDGEYHVFVSQQDSRLRAELVQETPFVLTRIPASRPATDRLRVTIPTELVGSPKGYRWFAATVDGYAQDFAPDRGGVLHDLTAPKITLTDDSFPELSTDVSATRSFPVTFSVSDKGGAGLAWWVLERRLLGTSSWTRLREGTVAGSKLLSVAGAQGNSYEFRIVATDAQSNRSVSEVRTVTVPVDDANTALTYEGVWTTGGASASDFRGTLHTPGDAGASATYAFTGSWVALIGRTPGGTAMISIDGKPEQEIALAAGAERAVVFSLDLAAAGTHTVRVTSASSAFSVDAFASR